jgi:ferredoxin
MKIYSVSEKQWAEGLRKAAARFKIYAPVDNGITVDYEELHDFSKIYYESNRPVTPLKAFFFPIKENVVQPQNYEPRVIIGVPACDLNALSLLDKIFLDEEFLDSYYENNRKNTILIGKDCYRIKDSCHCTTYGLNPYAEKNCDLSMSKIEQTIFLQAFTREGEDFIKTFGFIENSFAKLPESIEQKRKATVRQLREQNQSLPDQEKTRQGVLQASEEFWKKHASPCVSCGACATICPTCHCFLLIDKENFEKVRNWDTCQYPAFERVAAGEDPLKKLFTRLKNRYLCKFVHKPAMFAEIACTGCGRCIDACIGKINKNEVILAACK